MSHHDQDNGQDNGHDDGQDNGQGHDQSPAPAGRPGEHEEGATVSEGGSGALNADTALGGADAVPDTPDINDTGEADGIDISEQGQEDERR